MISPVMFEEWFQRVGSAVPRGFSRYYILQLLQKQPHTGKEIIDSAIEESGGRWKPSPGFTHYLGRLLDEGLIEEDSDNGKYQLQRKEKKRLEIWRHLRIISQNNLRQFLG